MFHYTAYAFSICLLYIHRVLFLLVFEVSIVAQWFNLIHSIPESLTAHLSILKRETDSDVTVVRDLNNQPTSTDCSLTQKLSKEASQLTNTGGHIDLVYIYRNFHILQVSNTLSIPLIHGMIL